EAASAIAAGVRRAMAGATVDEAPVSDGGPGLVDALIAGRGGERRTITVHDPLMRPIEATWALLPHATAVVEMAAASGLVLLAEAERDPLAATTSGVGELIVAALDAGCGNIIVGVGGSATVDAGAGALQALGARLLDASGADLDRGGAALADLDRIDLTTIDARVARAAIRVASDVRNPLYGPEGAAVVFGPQKGASQQAVATLDAALRRFAEVVQRDFALDLQAIEGSGAAGGLGAGLLVGTGATIEPGFPIVADAIGLRARVEAADLVVTGEGRLDSQTAYGKAAAGVAAVARECGKPVIAVAGTISDYDPSSLMFDAVMASTPSGMRLEDAMRAGAALVAEAAARLVRDFAR
ncbi:MAG: glycerate kinase, partial [Dehalococcoidia bacterium]